MKKAIALILCLMMVLSFVACGQKTTENTAKTDNTEYKPTGNINLIVPYAAGGAVDLGSRLMAKYAAKYTDANIVITNIGGAAGALGCAEVLKYGTDGSYMIALNPSMGYVSTPESPLSFEVTESFQYAAMMVNDPRTLVIRADETRFTNVEEFIEYCKANPGVTCGASGSGNDAYYAPYQFSEQLGLGMNVVAFDGTGDMKSAFLGGHIDIACATKSEAVTMILNGQCKIIVNAAPERPTGDEYLSDVPTMKEKGADVNFSTMRGFAFKAGTDEKILAYWSDVIGKVCADPEFLAEASSQGFPIEYHEYKSAQENFLAKMAAYKAAVASKAAN